MKNGLYKAEFRTPAGEGCGIIVANNGEIRGGDGTLYYVGSYQINGDQITAEIATDRHSDGTALLGQAKSNLTLSGEVSNDTVRCDGSPVGNPGIKLNVTLTRLCD